MADTAGPMLQWEVAVPLVTGGYFLLMVGRVLLATYAVVLLVMGTILLAGGEAGLLLPLAGWLAAGALGMGGLMALVMLAFFGNRWRARFTVGPEGVACETLNRAPRAASRVGAALGILAGRPGPAGSGLMAMSGEDVTLPWSGAFRAVPGRRPGLIRLANRWRTLLAVFCPPEDHDRVLAVLQGYIAARGTAERLPARSPLPRMLARTALVVAATAPLFAVRDLVDPGLFPAILMLCFALATVWLVPLFGWVILGVAAYEAGAILFGLLEVRASTLFPGREYRLAGILDAGDWVLLALAAAGLGYLAWLAVGHLRGRLASMLMEDEAA